MKKTLIILSVLSLISCNKQKLDDSDDVALPKLVVHSNKPQISIVGTFHFANTSDYSAIVLNDLNTEKRQAEIQQIVNDLAQYQPTKILVERPPALNDSLSKQLFEFKKGNYTLPNNELYQIGFRLAHKLNLKNIYGIDHPMNLGDETLVTYLQEHDLMNEFGTIISTSKEWAKEHTDYLNTHTIGKVLKELNTEEAEAFNRNLYLDYILNITQKGNSPASDFVANWYKRNICIKKNIDDVITKEDRVLVLIGAGHSALLKDFYKSSDAVEYVELNELLQ